MNEPSSSSKLGIALAAAYALAAALGAMPAVAAPRAVSAPRATVESILPHTPMHGLQGIVVGPDGALYVASLTGGTIHRVDPRTGEATLFVPAPEGSADDLAFGPDGTLVWSGGADHLSLMARDPSGVVRRLVRGTPGLNAVRFTADGRLLFTRIFAGDGLYELDRRGDVRVVREGLGGLNAFDFEPGGRIVGPLFLKGQVATVDVERGEVQPIADGLVTPSSVRRLPDGALLVLEYWPGRLWRIDPATGAKQRVAELPAPVDNLALAGDHVYATSTAWNGITDVDLRSGATRRVTWGELTAPGLLAAVSLEGRELVLVADQWAPRALDARSGAVVPVPLGRNGLGARAFAATGYRWLIARGPPAGNVLLVDRRTGDVVGQTEGIAAPFGLAVEPGGFAVADYGTGRVVHVDPDAALRQEVLVAGLAGPTGLVVDGAGGYFVTERSAGRLVHLARRETVAGTVSDSGFGATAVAEGFRLPEGIALDRDGRVLVVEAGAGRLWSVDPRSGRRAIVVDGLRLGAAGAADAAPSMPIGVAVAADGTIYVSGGTTNELYRVRRR